MVYYEKTWRKIPYITFSSGNEDSTITASVYFDKHDNLTSQVQLLPQHPSPFIGPSNFNILIFLQFWVRGRGFISRLSRLSFGVFKHFWLKFLKLDISKLSRMKLNIFKLFWQRYVVEFLVTERYSAQLRNLFCFQKANTLFKKLILLIWSVWVFLIKSETPAW